MTNLYQLTDKVTKKLVILIGQLSKSQSHTETLAILSDFSSVVTECYTAGYKDGINTVRRLATEDGPFKLIYEQNVVNEIVTNLLNDK